MYRVNITNPAKEDVDQNHAWWGDNRSQEEADRWYVGVIAAMHELGKTADRHTFATEKSLHEQGVKQCSFGLSRRPSHRILYGIEGDEVVVYRVRAFKQDAVGPENLRGE